MRFTKSALTKLALLAFAGALEIGGSAAWAQQLAIDNAQSPTPVLDQPRSDRDPLDLQMMVLLQAARDQTAERAQTHPGRDGRDYDEQLQAIDEALAQMHDGRPVTPAELNAALR